MSKIIVEINLKRREILDLCQLSTVGSATKSTK
jgi:hypothetical protein